MQLVLLSATVLFAIVSTGVSIPSRAEYGQPAYYTYSNRYQNPEYDHDDQYESYNNPPTNEVKSKEPSDYSEQTTASKPQYDYTDAQFQTNRHPQIHLQEPIVKFQFPRYGKKTYYSPYYNDDYSDSQSLENSYDPFPKFYLSSPPRVWVESPRYSVQAPKVRLVRPPTYPKEPDVKKEEPPEKSYSSATSPSKKKEDPRKDYNEKASRNTI